MYIGIDIGGTNIKGFLIDEEGNILNFKKISTPASAEGIDDEICNLIDSLAEQKAVSKGNIRAIGIGAAGSIDKKKGIIITSPNIHSWERYPLVKNIEKRVGIKVFLENDATVAVIGEWWKGHGQRFTNWIMLTLGTGIGGGAVINNRIYTGQSGSAMEFGHTSIDYRGKKCLCGSRGCLEIYASATSIVRFTKEKLSAYPESSIHNRLLKEKLTARLVHEEACKGDNLAGNIFNKVSTYLGIGISNFINIFNPEAVIIAGGLSGAHMLMLPVVKEIVKDRALKGLKEHVKYLVVKEEGSTPALGAAKAAMDARKKNIVIYKI